VTAKPWVGVSPAHEELLATLVRVAPKDVEILISGPTGVGKELYARFAHERSRRGGRAFVPVNCGSIPSELLENELFGHVGGAFTGARPLSDGLVAEADGGTLFLDEIDTLSMPNQVKLLRFIQEKEYRRLGEGRIRRADVRIIAATNADLVEASNQRRFREDLLFRLRVVPIVVPPLCARTADVMAIFDALADWYAERYELPRIVLTHRAEERILAYRWPGNVRELENCVRYLTCLQLARPVDPADLPLISLHASEGAPVSNLMDAQYTCDVAGAAAHFRTAKAALVREFERTYVARALQAANGNIARAARAAGKPRRAFFELMRKHRLTAHHDDCAD